MAATTEAFNDTKLEVANGVFIAESNKAHQYVNDLRNGHLLIDIDEQGISIVHSGQIEDEAPHTGSESNYRGRMLHRMDEVFFYTLDQDQYTSAHEHQVSPHPMSELYVAIGTCYLYIEDEGVKTLNGSLKEPAFETVRAGAKHCVWTVDKKAFNAVTTVNSLRYPKDKRHIHVPNQKAFKEAARSKLLPIPYSIPRFAWE